MHSCYRPTNDSHDFHWLTANSAVFFLFIAGESTTPTPGDNMESPTPGDNMESPTPGENMESSTTPGEMDPSGGMAAFPLPYPSQGSSFPLPLPGTFQCMPTVCLCCVMVETTHNGQR